MSFKHITFYSHNVVTNLGAVSSHLNIPKGSLKYKFFSLGLSYYYRLLGHVVDQFVVMDHPIEKRLSLFVPEDKIFLSPFWIESVSPALSRLKARKQLGIQKDEVLLLYFGFITHYKGADWVIHAVKELQEKKEFRKVRLILAGGEAYSLKDKKHYKEYYKNILESVRSNTGIQITGFVPEEKIASYFLASDVTLFAYRGLIGASGSMQHAMKYHKPFLLNKKMHMVLESPDMQTALSNNGLTASDVTFSQNGNSFEKLIRRFIHDKQFKKQLTGVSETIAETRSRKNLIEACYNKLFEDEKKSYTQSTRILPIPAENI